MLIVTQYMKKKQGVEKHKSLTLKKVLCKHMDVKIMKVPFTGNIENGALGVNEGKIDVFIDPDQYLW